MPDPVAENLARFSFFSVSLWVEMWVSTSSVEPDHHKLEQQQADKQGQNEIKHGWSS
jgi:hypothetical protein